MLGVRHELSKDCDVSPKNTCFNDVDVAVCPSSIVIIHIISGLHSTTKCTLEFALLGQCIKIQ